MRRVVLIWEWSPVQDIIAEGLQNMTDGFISIGGYLNVIAGQTLLVYWHAFAIFLSYRDLSTTLAFLVKNRNWQWINGLGV